MFAYVITIANLLQQAFRLLLSGVLSIGLTCVVVVIFILLYRRLRYKTRVVACWFHYFTMLHLSSQAFYKTLEIAIDGLCLPNVETSRVLYPEGGLLSTYREYLRVTCCKTVFEICAAPFGHNFFISCQQRRKLSIPWKFIPFAGQWLEQVFNYKTYYETDREEAFKQCIHNVLEQAIADLKRTSKLYDPEEIRKECLAKIRDKAKKWEAQSPN